MNAVKCNNEVSRPEFAAILENFREELGKLDENSGVIMEKACQFQDFREQSKVCEEDQKSPEGIIGELQQCINRVKFYNYRLNEVKNGLIGFIG